MKSPEAAEAARLNGLDPELLRGTADHFRDHPEAATVIIRTRHGWDRGFAVDGHTQEIEEVGGMTPRAFTFRTAWPPEIGGQDSGPSPGEALLGALGRDDLHHQGSHTRIEIDQLEVVIEATVDLRGVFELDAVRAGLAGAVATNRVRSDAGDAVLDELGQAVTRVSAVYDSLANPVPVRLAVERLQ